MSEDWNTRSGGDSPKAPRPALAEDDDALQKSFDREYPPEKDKQTYGSKLPDSRSLKKQLSGIDKDDSGIVAVWEHPEPSPRRFAVGGLVPDGAVTILYGDGGLGKSYLALYIASCVAAGIQIAGQPVEKRPVLYLDAELDEEEFKRRAYSVARGLGRDRPPEGLYYWKLPGSLADKGLCTRALQYAQQCKAGLVIVDSLTVASGGLDPKEAADVIPLLKQLERFGTVVAIDHIRTPEPGTNKSEYRPFGSAFKHHLARSLITVTKGSSGVLALHQTKANFTRKGAIAYLTLQIDEKTRSAIVTFLGPGDERVVGMADVPADERVLQALAASPSGTSTPQTLAKELELASKTISNHLTALLAKGRVERLGDGRWCFLPDPSFRGTGNGNGTPETKGAREIQSARERFEV